MLDQNSLTDLPKLAGFYDPNYQSYQVDGDTENIYGWSYRELRSYDIF